MSVWLSETLVLLHALGWAVIHAAWIGGLVVALAAIVARGLSRARPDASYGVMLGALVSVAALPWIAGAHMTSEYVQHVDWVRRAERAIRADEGPGAPPRAVWAAVVGQHRRMYRSPFQGRPSVIVGTAVAGLAVLWLGLFAWRALVLARSWLRLRRALALVEPVRAGPWLATLERLRARMGVRREVRVATTPRGTVPMVAGVRRPVILIPCRVYETLAGHHIEAVLAHELVHVARMDLVTVFVQRLAEVSSALIPARGWLSARVDEERECAADTRACGVLPDPRSVYVDALVALETARPGHGELELALGGRGDLLRRVRRLAISPVPVRPVAVLLACALTLTACWAIGRQVVHPLLRASIDLVMEHDLARHAPS